MRKGEKESQNLMGVEIVISLTVAIREQDTLRITLEEHVKNKGERSRLFCVRTLVIRASQGHRWLSSGTQQEMQDAC